MGNQYYKKKALDILRENWWREISYIMIIITFTVILQYIDSGVISLVLSIAMIPVNLGYTRHIINIARGNNPEGIGDIFYYYKNSGVMELIMLSILVNIIVLLGTLLFIIPGIILMLAYAMAINIKIENPDKPVTEALRDSMELMKGRKMEYMWLTLSFIGWYIIGAITIIGIIPVTIYINVTTGVYYVEAVDSGKLTVSAPEVE